MQEEEGTLSQQQGPCSTSLPLASHSNEMFLPLVQELYASLDFNRTSVLPACCEKKIFACIYLLAFIIVRVFSLLLEMTRGTQVVVSSSPYACVCGVDQDLMERLGGMEVRKKLGGGGRGG
ncbi:hypothetical protein NC651_035759 [Populus alba x Populus x berolinensis]|nr:hypothetical protein NC651_035759 [Populus alba x Populus x berolinensis]